MSDSNRPSWLNADGTGVPTGLEKWKVIGGAVGNWALARLTGAGLSKGAERNKFGGTPGTAVWTTRNGAQDWRLKLTIPSESSFLQQIFFDRATADAFGTSSQIMEPLVATNGILFPVTPTVLIQHTAAYSQLATTHANYPYYAYQNSETSSIAITGEFPVQNQYDAAHWVATIHFLRAVTKMFFGGDDATRGNPPPILKLNGYGQHVFKNVPVVVTNFTCDLRADVDYIATSQGTRKLKPSSTGIKSFGGSNAVLPTTWAPTLSTITLQVQPVYSRDTVKNFSMRDFVSGKLSNKNGVGFI